MTISSQAQTYTSDTNIADFTALVTRYATFGDYGAIDGGCGSPTFTPTAAELASIGCRVYYGSDTSESLPATNNWILASFSSPVSTIVVFPNIDHYGSAYDGYQYQIYGSNDGVNWTFLYDTISVTGGGEPFTLGSYAGSAPTTVNNVLTPQSIGLPPSCTGTSTPCAVGYIAQFTFGTAYQFYAFGASTEASNSGNTDQELSAVGTTATIVQTFSPNGPTTSNFGTPGAENQQTIDTSDAAKDLVCNGSGEGTSSCGTITLVTTNTLISNNDPAGIASWSQYVVGTPWGPSVCAARPANGVSANLCSLFVNQCFGGNANTPPSQASDFYCPMVASGSPSSATINLTDTFDPPSSMLGVPAGTTVSLIDFTPSSPTEAWMPFMASSSNPSNPVCTNVSGTGTPPTTTPTQCDVADSLIDVYGDQTTTHGSKPKKGWLISVFDVPMPVTSVEVLPAPGCSNPNSMLNDPNPNNPDFGSPTYAANIWNNGKCLLDFLVNPAVIPNSILGNGANNFQAAPPAVLFWGPADPPVQPGTIPPSGDTVYYNPSPICTMGYPCTPKPWDVQVSNLTPLHTNIPLSTLGLDGPHTIHYSSADLVGISEKNIQLLSSGICYNPADVSPGFTPPCYNTSYFTTQVNIDSQPPTITSNGFSPAGSPAGTFGVGETVYPVYTCTDQVGLSGMAKCGGLTEGTPGSSCPLAATPLPTTFSPLNTSSQGPQQYTQTAMDCAGNVTTSVVKYNVLPPADVAIYELETTDHPKHGTNFTYVAWALDLGLQNAYGVGFTFQIPVPTNVVGGPVTGLVADCTLAGCSAPPVTGRNCNVASSVSGLITTYTISCNVGTLASLWTGHGSVAAVMIPIANSGAIVGDQFGITATVASSGDPNLKNNTTKDTITVK